MKLLALCALALVNCVPNAPGAGCAPISCGSSQVTLAHGSLLGIRSFGSSGPLRVVDLGTGVTRWRLPSGILGANLLVHQDGTLLTWFNATTGTRVGETVAQTRGSFLLTGVSQNGTRAVLARTQRRSTTFVIASRTSQRRVVLGKNNWSFDALSGTKLYLLQYLKQGYVVRLYDLARNKLVAKPLKDASESAVISGVPWVRQASADGRYLFTLYISSAGNAMVHQLDVRAGTAKCIDLPGSGDFNSATNYALVSDPDGRTLWAVSPGYGKVASIDVAAARVRESYGFVGAPVSGPGGSVAAMAPDGEHLAVATAGKLWFFTLALRRVGQVQPRIALALAFSPDDRRLWTLGQKSRITALTVPWLAN